MISQLIWFTFGSAVVLTVMVTGPWSAVTSVTHSSGVAVVSVVSLPVVSSVPISKRLSVLKTRVFYGVASCTSPACAKSAHSTKKTVILSVGRRQLMKSSRKSTRSLPRQHGTLQFMQLACKI